MNESYKILDNKVFVYDEAYNESVRELTNNIKDILITENNIDEIEELMDYEIYTKDLSMTRLTMSSFLGLGSSNIIVGAYRSITDGISSSLFNILVGAVFCTLSYQIGIKPFIEDRKNLKFKKFILEDLLSKEKEKLNELNKDKSNNLTPQTDIQEVIFTSEEIKNLKDRLDDINLYISNRKKLIKFYKKGNLYNLFYEYSINAYTIDFIKELIEFDLGIKTKIETNTPKTLEKSLKHL